MRFSVTLLIVALLPAIILAEISPLCFGPQCPVVNAIVTGVRGSTVVAGSIVSSSLVGSLGAAPAVVVSEDLATWSAAKTVGELPAQLTGVATSTDGGLVVVSGPGNDNIPGLLMSENAKGPYQEIVFDDVRYSFAHVSLTGISTSQFVTVFSAVGSRSLPPDNATSSKKAAVGTASAYSKRRLGSMATAHGRSNGQRGETSSFVLVFDNERAYSVNIPDDKENGPITGLAVPAQGAFFVSRSASTTGTGGSKGGVWRADDDGFEWSQVYSAPAGAVVGAISCVRGGEICVVPTAYNLDGLMMRTEDGGKTWGVAGNIDDIGTEFTIDAVSVSNFGKLIVAGASVKNEDRAVVAYSRDGGKTWKQENLPGRPRRITAVTVKPDEMGAVITSTGPDCRGDVTTVYEFTVTE